MSTPEQIKEHSHKYKDGAWRLYSFEELVNWVQLLSKRATHRTELEKIQKDLTDAENYLAMINEKFAEFKQQILEQHETQNSE